MAVRHETELYAPVKAFFENLGYEVKGEVRNCDLVGIKPGQQTPLIVEIKKTFNLALVLQGMQRLKLSSNVYVAVERNRAKKGAVNQRWNELVGLCRQLGLGLLTVTHFKTKPPLVEVLCSLRRIATMSTMQQRYATARARKSCCGNFTHAAVTTIPAAAPDASWSLPTGKKRCA